MAAFLRNLAILIVSFLHTPILAQEASESPSADISEDQLIAEAIWSLVDFGFGKTADVQTAFRKAETAFPNSARVAYWRGRFGVYASDRAQVLGQLSETLETLSKPTPDEPEISDPSVRTKLRNVRSYAATIGKRIQELAKEASVDDSTGAFETSYLESVSRDPDLIAAWSGLLESSDTTIALTAADAWARQEPDNALPLYAKAVILTRDAKIIGTSEIDIAAIEALELGNARPFCKAPDEPWPTEFRLEYPSSVPDDVDAATREAYLAEFAGKPVSQNDFLRIVEAMFFQVDAIGGGATISESSLRDLGGLVLSRSHRLPAEADVRYLRAFAGVAVHLVNSNRAMYGITAGGPDRVLNRLETIALDQGDFDHAQQIVSVRDYVMTTRRKIGDDYRAAERGDDPSSVDRNATRVMERNKRSIEIPPIDLDEESEGLLITSNDDASPDIDMVHIDLLLSGQSQVFARRRGQRLPNEKLKNDELEQRGYYRFQEAVEEVRSKNRERRLRRGFFFVARDKGIGSEIANWCYSRGYLGKRDACIVAFLERKQLESFRENYGHVDVRIAQVLGPGDVIDRDDLDTISPMADVVVVPVHRLINSNGRVPPLVRSSKLSFIVTGSQVGQRNVLAQVKNLRSVVGVFESPILQIEQSRPEEKIAARTARPTVPRSPRRQLSDFETSIYRMEMDGSSLRKLARVDGYRFHSLPFISPNGKKLSWFATSKTTSKPSLFIGELDGTVSNQINDAYEGLWLDDQTLLVSEDGNLVKISANDDGSKKVLIPGVRPTLSNNRRFLAYEKENNLFVRNLESGEERAVIVSPPARTINRLSISNDGERLAYVGNGQARGVYVSDLTTGDSQLIANEPGSEYWPKFSHDGNQVLFTAGDFSVSVGSHLNRIYVANISEKTSRPLTPEDYHCRGASWSPDCQSIVFESIKKSVVDANLRRMTASNNLKKIGLAMHKYHSAYKKLPDRAMRDEEGNPLLSWRVAILPFVGQQALHKQFHLDEPWDSPHNIKLLEQMPTAYVDPSAAVAPGHTVFQVSQGERLMFEEAGERKFRDVVDGLSNTIMVVESSREAAVPWTKPADLEFDLSNPLAQTGDVHQGGFHVLMADGAVIFLTNSIPPQLFNALLTRAGKESMESLLNQ